MLAWGDLGFGYTYRDVGMVAFPTDSGWSPGEEIPGAEEVFTTPLVTRDRNGDVWAMWRVQDFMTNRWTHTYVHATCSTPAVTVQGRSRRLSWTLSEPAPESWWMVLRSRNGGSFEEAARVQAGAGLEVSWCDDSPPAGVLRYKVRRESIDSRYHWESDEALWQPTAKGPLKLIRPGAIGLAQGLELVGAEAGPVEVRIYDIQGRLVLTRQFTASGNGRDSLPLDLHNESDPGAGIYFASARDVTGRAAHPLKIVLLK